MKRLLALALVLLLCSCALAEEETVVISPTVQDYMALVNETLTAQGSTTQVDVCYECYETYASLGLNGAELPIHSTIELTLSGDGITSAVLRMDSLTGFAEVGAALVYASNPAHISLAEALSAVQGYVQQAQNLITADSISSFEEQVLLTQGLQTRLYGAFYPNQYHDNYNWMQLTIVFPLPDSAEDGLFVAVTDAPAEEGSASTDDPDEISGYFPFDGYGENHLEIFPMATPEPDSAAMEPNSF